MVDVIVLLDGIGLILSAVLATLVGRRSIKAYNLTGRTHLLNFSAGFICLALSYLATIAIALYLYFPPYAETHVLQLMGQTPILPRLIMELLGFALIASSYYTRDRAGSLTLLLLVMGTAVVAVFSAAIYAPFSSTVYTGSVRLFDTTLILYTLIQVSRSYTTKIVPAAFFVCWGFGMLMLSQYTWLIWSYSGGLLTAELAMALRIFGLAILVYSVRK